MTIERLGPVDPVSKFNKTNKVTKPVKKEDVDSVNFSPEAKNMGEIYKAAENVKTAPEIRQDRVDEVKRKLEDPSYVSEKVVEAVADSIMDVFGLS